MIKILKFWENLLVSCKTIKEILVDNNNDEMPISVKPKTIRKRH